MKSLFKFFAKKEIKIDFLAERVIKLDCVCEKLLQIIRIILVPILVKMQQMVDMQM